MNLSVVKWKKKVREDVTEGEEIMLIFSVAGLNNGRIFKEL
jgi:hypothetical protein